MREIKFRAWDKDEQKMIEPVEFTKMLRQVSSKDDNSTGGDAIRRHDLVWMQFTGLKDKNGVEIYEGDILIDDEYPEEGITYATVEWGHGGWDADPWFGVEEFFKEAENYEVISNIYENPELLAPTN